MANSSRPAPCRRVGKARKTAPKPSGLMGKVKFQRLDLADIKPGKICLLIGKRGSGKTTLLEAMAYANRHQFDHVIAFVGTLDTAKDFGRFMPPDRIVVFGGDGVPDSTLQRLNLIMELQELFKLTKTGAAPGKEDEWKPKTVLLITDDLMDDPKWLKSKVLRRLHVNGRHFE